MRRLMPRRLFQPTHNSIWNQLIFLKKSVLKWVLSQFDTNWKSKNDLILVIFYHPKRGLFGSKFIQYEFLGRSLFSNSTVHFVAMCIARRPSFTYWINTVWTNIDRVRLSNEIFYFFSNQDYTSFAINRRVPFIHFTLTSQSLF